MTDFPKTVNDRLILLRSYLGVSRTGFAKGIGFSRSHVSEIESSKNSPSKHYIDIVVQKTGVSESWLISGEGPMFKDMTIDEGETLIEPKVSLSFVEQLDQRIRKYNVDGLPREAIVDALNMVEALVEILTADEEEETKTSIRNNLRTFQEKVREKRELIEYRKQRKGQSISVDRKLKLYGSDTESDFKTQDTQRESKHPKDTHRAGGK